MINTYIKEKVLSHWNTIKVFHEDLQEKTKTVESVAQVIKTLKSKSKELTPIDVKDMLSDMMMTNYEIVMREQELLRTYIPMFIEFKMMADINKIDVDFSKEDLELIQRITNKIPALYAVDKNKVVPKDPETYEVLIAKAKANSIAEENLIGLFNSKQLQVNG